MIYIIYVEKINTYPEKSAIIEAGLEEKEALIYLAALKIGGGTISELAAAMHLERSGIYYHIDKLLGLGLLETISRGKHRVFLPADPINLKKMAQERQKRLDKIIPELSNLFARKMNRSITEYFQGKDDVDRFYNRVYELMTKLEPADNEILVLGSSYKKVTSIYKKFSIYDQPKKQIDVRLKSILLKSEKSKGKDGNRRDPYIVTRYNLPDAEIKYMDDKYAYPGAIVMFTDWIVLLDYRNMTYSITENKNMAATWKMFFRFIWDNLPKK